VKHRSWLLAAVVALLAVLVLAAFPVRAYRDQGRQREELRQRVAALDAASAELERKAEDLRDPARVEALARERYQLVRPGEEAYSILPSAVPPAPEPTRRPRPSRRRAGSRGPGRS